MQRGGCTRSAPPRSGAPSPGRVCRFGRSSPRRCSDTSATTAAVAAFVASDHGVLADIAEILLEASTAAWEEHERVAVVELAAEPNERLGVQGLLVGGVQPERLQCAK